MAMVMMPMSQILLPGDECFDAKSCSLALWCFQYCSTTIMNDLSALCEHQPSWREWLSTHLMPLYIFERLPDGQIGVYERVMSESAPDPTETSTAYKVEHWRNMKDIETTNIRIWYRL